MNRLSHSLRFGSFAAFTNLIILLLIPTESRTTSFFHFSFQRWLLILSLTLPAVLMIWLDYKLKRNREQALNIEQSIRHNMQATWTGRLVHLAAGIIVSLLVCLFVGYLRFFNEYLQVLLLRLAPLSLFLFIIALQLMVCEPFGNHRWLWPRILLLSILGMITGLLLQQVLLEQLKNPVKVPYLYLMFIWISTFFLCIFWLSLLHQSNKIEQTVWTWITFLAIAVVISHWHTYPKGYGPVEFYLVLLAPIFILLLLLTTKAIFALHGPLKNLDRSSIKRAFWLSAAVVSVILAAFFYQAATDHAHTINKVLEERDQGTYLKLAKTTWLSHYRYAGDFNRMPLYPWLLAIFYHPEMSDLQFFEQGKLMNIILVLVLLGLFFWICTRYFPPPHSYLLTLIVAFSLFLFKSPYMKVELLFYFLAFAGFVLMLEMLRKPTVWLAVLTGIVTGLAYLSKATALPSLAIFTGVYILGELVHFINRVKTRLSLGNPSISALRGLSYLVFCLLMFLAITYPYTRITKQRFGHFFFNVNSTFYIWYDSYPEARISDFTYGLSQKQTDLPADQIPNLWNYVRQHRLQQIVNRLKVGLYAQAYNFFHPYSLTNFPLSYFLILCCIMAADIKNTLQWVGKYPYQILFQFLYFSLYLAAFFWYAYIAAGPRFLYGLYLPFMFSMFLATQTLADQQPHEKEARLDLQKFSLAANLMMVVILLVNVYFALDVAMLADQFGS